MRIILLLFTVLYGASLSAQDSIRIHFAPLFGGQNMVLDNAYLLHEDTVLITSLKCYITDISFYLDDSIVHGLSKQHHLLDVANPGSLTITAGIKAPLVFNTIKFSIGVDSLTQVSGAFEGDLDPTTGMYWSWQSGYINFKLEGTSSVCPSRRHKFQWHIGGYQHPYNTFRGVILALKPAQEVAIEIHIDRLFTVFDVSEVYQVMSPHARAVQIANAIPEIFKAPN